MPGITCDDWGASTPGHELRWRQAFIPDVWIGNRTRLPLRMNNLWWGPSLHTHRWMKMRTEPPHAPYMTLMRTGLPHSMYESILTRTRLPLACHVLGWRLDHLVWLIGVLGWRQFFEVSFNSSPCSVNFYSYSEIAMFAVSFHIVLLSDACIGSFAVVSLKCTSYDLDPNLDTCVTLTCTWTPGQCMTYIAEV